MPAGAAHSPEAQILMQYAEELQRLWDEGFKATVENRQAGKKNTAPEGGVKYSISNIVGASGNNYGVGVILDSTLLDNLTDAERVQMVKLYIESIQGQTFVAYDSVGAPVNIKVEENSKKFRNSKGRVVPVNRDLLTKHRTDEIKQETIVLADQLLSVAKEGQTTAAMHPHDWLDNNGLNPWGQWTAIVQDKSGAVWEATLQIANATTGEKILYDIHPIKKVEGRGNSRTTSTANNIAQKAKAVNSKNTGTGNNPHSVEDSVSDRSLLLEAAEREGAGASEELRRFANRMKELESLQRRLERQEKKLEEMTGETLETPPHQSALRTASPQGEAQGAERTALEERIDGSNFAVDGAGRVVVQ